MGWFSHPDCGTCLFLSILVSNERNVSRSLRKRRQAGDDDNRGPILGLITSLIPGQTGRSGDDDDGGPIQTLINIILGKIRAISGLTQHLGNLLGRGDRDGDAPAGPLRGLIGNLLDGPNEV